MTPSSYFKLVWLDNNKGVRAGIGGFLVCAIVLMSKLFHETRQLSAWAFVIVVLVFYYSLFFICQSLFFKKILFKQAVKNHQQNWLHALGGVCTIGFCGGNILLTIIVLIFVLFCYNKPNLTECDCLIA